MDIEIHEGRILIVYAAADLAAAKLFFRELTGTDPYADAPRYVGDKIGNVQIGLDPNGGRNGPGALASWTVNDIAASMSTLVDAGGTVVQQIGDVGYGLLVASVQDSNGATVGYDGQTPKGKDAP